MASKMEKVETQRNVRLENVIEAELELAKRLIGNLGSSIILAFTGLGEYYNIEIEGIRPIAVDDSLGVEGLKLPAISMMLKRRIFESFRRYIQIPLALVRVASNNIIVLEAQGLRIVTESPRFIVYEPEPTQLGWYFIYAEIDQIIGVEKDLRWLEVLNTVLDRMSEITKKTVNLSPASRVVHDLKAVPSPIRITNEDVNEYLMKKKGLDER